MSQELPRSWVLPLLLAATAATPISVEPSPPAAERVETPSSRPEAAQHLAEAIAPRTQPVRLGPWRLVAELGRGGMGTVYLAESSEAPFRHAALKVIRADRVTAATRAQFATEQQALATADHEHIARLYDTGTTQHGEPWLAMELVRGEPLTSYCDRRALDVDARLQLLVGVGDAIQHLHERGIRHGDLKPENILVVERAGRAVPKLIDFGLAALRGRAPVEEDAAGGTVEYMAPEQFTMPAGAIDERSEIYALGVLVHEVLTGARPGRAAVVSADGRTEVLLGEASAPAIDRSLRGGLRRTLARALASRREARHGSVDEFVAELRRDLGHCTMLRHVLRTGCTALAAAAAGLAAGWLAFA